MYTRPRTTWTCGGCCEYFHNTATPYICHANALLYSLYDILLMYVRKQTYVYDRYNLNYLYVTYLIVGLMLGA